MRQVILLFLVILFAFSAFGEPLTISHNRLSNYAEPGKSVIFELKIRNDQNFDDTFVISKDELGELPFSDVIKSVSIEPSQIDLEAHETESVVVKFDILEDAIPGKNYKTFVKVRSVKNPGLKMEHDFLIEIAAPENIIEIDANFPETIYPGREVIFQVDIKNTANILLEDVEIYIISDLFSKKYKEKFYAYQDITKELRFDVGQDVKPGEYILGVKAYKDDEIRGSFVREFQVSVNPDIEERKGFESGWFSKSLIITKTNDGNIPAEESYSISFGWLQDWFIGFDKEPDKAIGNNYEWHFILEPNQSNTIRITYYNRLVYVLLFATVFLLIGFLWLFKRKVIIRKTIIKVDDDKKELNKFKVMLHIKNNTGKSVKNLKVYDVLPSIVKSSKEFGTLKPNKVQRGEKSSRLVWDVDSLEKHEERIISYNVVSNLRIIGNFRLPPALVRYKGKNKRLVEVKSNVVTDLI